MGYALRPGLSYCTVDGHDVFLDLAADRYFRLSDKPEAAFQRLREEASVPTSDLAELHDLGLVEEVVSSGGLLPPTLDMPMTSAAAMGLTRAAPMPTVRALWAQRCMERFLQSKGLEAAVARLRGEKDRLPVVAQGGGAVERWILGFEQAKLLRSPAKRCLPRSMALASCLVRAGHGVNLVIGVRLRPFAAHCWVQQGSTVLNDTPEDVAMFTPILVI